MPLVHPPGHAQADFGEGFAFIAGEQRKAHFLVFALPHGDAVFLKAYPAETTEAMPKPDQTPDAATNVWVLCRIMLR